MVMRGDDDEGDDHDEDDEDADYELVMMIMLVLTLEGPCCALGGSSSSHGGVLGRSWRLVGGFLARSWVAPGARPKSLSKSEAPTWQPPPPLPGGFRLFLHRFWEVFGGSRRLASGSEGGVFLEGSYVCMCVCVCTCVCVLVRVSE